MRCDDHTEAAETATAPQADTAPQAEPDRVPTVSSVFSKLGLAHDTGVEAEAGQATTVAMLESMVEELAASMPARPRRAKAASTPDPIAETVSLPEPDPPKRRPSRTQSYPSRSRLPPPKHPPRPSRLLRPKRSIRTSLLR